MINSITPTVNTETSNSTPPPIARNADGQATGLLGVAVAPIQTAACSISAHPISSNATVPDNRVDAGGLRTAPKKNPFEEYKDVLWDLSGCDYLRRLPPKKSGDEVWFI